MPISNCKSARLCIDPNCFRFGSGPLELKIIGRGSQAFCNFLNINTPVAVYQILFFFQLESFVVTKLEIFFIINQKLESKVILI